MIKMGGSPLANDPKTVRFEIDFIRRYGGCFSLEDICNDSSLDFKNIRWHEAGVNNAINKFELIKGTKLEKEWSEFFQYSIFYSIFKMLLVSAYNSDKRLYKKYKNEIKKYRNNEYFKDRFRKNYGNLKTFIVYNIIFKNYYLTKLATKFL